MEVKHTQRAKAPPTCTQPIHERWVMGQGYQRVWFSGGEKDGVYFGVPTQTLLGSKTLETKCIRTSFCICWQTMIKTMSLGLSLLKVYLL